MWKGLSTEAKASKAAEEKAHAALLARQVAEEAAEARDRLARENEKLHAEAKRERERRLEADRKALVISSGGGGGGGGGGGPLRRLAAVPLRVGDGLRNASLAAGAAASKAA